VRERKVRGRGSRRHGAFIFVACGNQPRGQLLCGHVVDIIINVIRDLIIISRAVLKRPGGHFRTRVLVLGGGGQQQRGGAELLHGHSVIFGVIFLGGHTFKRGPVLVRAGFQLTRHVVFQVHRSLPGAGPASHP